jgi:predicted helicase
MNNNDTERKAKIFYFSLTDEMKKGEKLNWFLDNDLEEIPFERIRPDNKGYWLNITDSDFETLIPVCNKQTKLAKETKNENAIFKLHSLGVVTNRDEWVYDFNTDFLVSKTKFFIDFYNNEIKRWKSSDKKQKTNDFVDRSIKWTSELEDHMKKGSKIKFDKNRVTRTLYRPFTFKYLYFDRMITHRIYQNEKIWGIKKMTENIQICFSGISSAKRFQTYITNIICGLDFLEKTNCLPFYRYDNEGNRTENITDWGLQQFQNHYTNENITKEDIFYYVYAVLHNPDYRKKYEQELKREYPRIPYYSDFQKWCDWGKQLANIHLNFENIEPYPLKENNFEIKAEAKRQIKELSIVGEPEVVYNRKVKTKLKADKEVGIIEIDELTFLSGVPSSAWQYQLGSRSAIEWILDQYKEKEPSEPIIAEKFNTYKFSEHKNHVIDLIKRVCNVSVKTMQIIDDMQLK